VDVRKRRAADS